MKTLKLFPILAFCFFLIFQGCAREDFVEVAPLEFQGALANPLKGFRPDLEDAGTRKYDDIFLMVQKKLFLINVVLFVSWLAFA